MNFCPCLQTFLRRFKSEKRKGSYEGHREFQEEEFMNPSNDETSLNDRIPPPAKKQNNIEQQLDQYFNSPAEANKLPEYVEEKEPEAESESLNIKLQLGVGKEEKKEGKEVKEERDIELLIQEELLLTPADAVKKIEVGKEPIVENVFEFEDLAEPVFSINIDPLDPHFAMLHEKTAKLPQLLRKTGIMLQVGSPNKANLRITQVDNNKASTFVLNYKLNCSYSYYLSIFKNDYAFTNLNSLIAEAKVLESYKPNLTLNTLKFRRIKGFEPRDCFYVKYQNGGKRQHWEIYLNDETAQRNPAYKTCEVFCAKSIKQTSESELTIVEYLQVDFGSTNTISILPKLASELLNFLNTLSDHIDRNFEQQLV